MNDEVKKSSVRKEKLNIFLWNFFFLNIGKLGFLFFTLSYIFEKRPFELYITTFIIYVGDCVNESRIDYLEKKIDNLLKDENII